MTQNLGVRPWLRKRYSSLRAPKRWRTRPREPPCRGPLEYSRPLPTPGPVAETQVLQPHQYRTGLPPRDCPHTSLGATTSAATRLPSRAVPRLATSPARGAALRWQVHADPSDNTRTIAAPAGAHRSRDVRGERQGCRVARSRRRRLSSADSVVAAERASLQARAAPARSEMQERHPRNVPCRCRGNPRCPLHRAGRPAPAARLPSCPGQRRQAPQFRGRQAKAGWFSRARHRAPKPERCRPP